MSSSSLLMRHLIAGWSVYEGWSGMTEMGTVQVRDRLGTDDWAHAAAAAAAAATAPKTALK